MKHRYRVVALTKKAEKYLLKRKWATGIFKQVVESYEPFTIRFDLRLPIPPKKLRTRELVDKFNDYMLERGFTPGADFKASEVSPDE